MAWPWILGVLVLAVGVHLYFYNRRRRALIRDFAKRRGLDHHPEGDPALEESLENAFDFGEVGLTRTLGRIRDIVRGEKGLVIFRATELLDLNPHGATEFAHHGRIAVSFPTVSEGELFVVVSPQLHYDNRHPTRTDYNGDPTFRVLKRVLERKPPPHTLSVTVTRGRVLLYLEPLVTGSEKPEDLKYLFRLARALRAVFRSSVLVR
jgi:hypothetical protein